MRHDRKARTMTQAARIPAIDPKIADSELARRVATGEEAALRLLMKRHNQTLFRTARAILRDDAEAEDAVQDAYLKAIRGIDAFRSDSKLSTWLVRITVNEALGRLRRTRRAAEVIPLAADRGEGMEAHENVMDENTPTPEQEALRAESRRIMEAKIDALPDAFRAVFVLRSVEEMSVEETARCLDIPEATVRTRHFRARSLLREALAQEIDLAERDVFAFDGARCDRIVAAVLARVAAGL
jgi:RNA polymerase sigma-70 factor (ECF subfamily)